MGALGMVIGHEISGGFETTGMLYDKHRVTADWWNDENRCRLQEASVKMYFAPADRIRVW